MVNRFFIFILPALIFSQFFPLTKLIRVGHAENESMKSETYEVDADEKAAMDAYLLEIRRNKVRQASRESARSESENLSAAYYQIADLERDLAIAAASRKSANIIAIPVALIATVATVILGRLARSSGSGGGSDLGAGIGLAFQAVFGGSAVITGLVGGGSTVYIIYNEVQYRRILAALEKKKAEVSAELKSSGHRFNR